MHITEDDIIHIIEQDDWMMDILHVVNRLALPDWWISAGFVRSKVWDYLHMFPERTPLPDVDVIYFDGKNKAINIEKTLENKLNRMSPHVPWSVKNQARMAEVNGVTPYLSSEDAIAKFPETATALGVKLDEQNKVILTAPCGLEDLVNLQVKPTPFFKQNNKRFDIYKTRVKRKKWQAHWQQLTIHNI